MHMIKGQKDWSEEENGRECRVSDLFIRKVINANIIEDKRTRVPNLQPKVQILQKHRERSGRSKSITDQIDNQEQSLRLVGCDNRIISPELTICLCSEASALLDLG